MSNEDTLETFSYLTRAIRDAYPTFSYLHVPEPRVAGSADRDPLKGESNDFMKDIWLNGMCYLPSILVIYFSNKYFAKREGKTTTE